MILGRCSEIYQKIMAGGFNSSLPTATKTVSFLLKFDGAGTTASLRTLSGTLEPKLRSVKKATQKKVDKVVRTIRRFMVIIGAWSGEG
ncbi:hypothetical protein BCR41DRAFT_344372 [Lobosporangium transversale]|uniref:Uncharacterized protein n=1 Tax=Lobosporangium transversale TaxID=64571 RepID=A0A1Y2H340_9FUNG|nr:hypothetical protein BCR41DRAFT_344372 [Lobosporangium transversale]ORZ28979.1 hypothetical protein BCR41DRAFT_344372 [Lobosporangium transversale]|eukprot:XP_021886652.1 hypothetical protein BCR41DRAFT_344372 [Lobosporangium transversale]